MNILINTSNLKIGGGLQVAHSTLYELRKYTQHCYVVVLSKALELTVDQQSFPANFVFISYTLQTSILNLISGRNKVLDRIVAEYNIDKVFSVFGPTYWDPKVFHVCGFAKPHYIYKDSPFYSIISYTERLKLKLKEIIHLRSFKAADILVTENSDVSLKLQKLFPKNKVLTVTNYYNQIFENQKNWKPLLLDEFDGVTLLTVAANYPHKNLRIIPKVISYLNSKYPDFKVRFVLSVKNGGLGEIEDAIKNQIVFLGKIDVDQCPSLYTQADIMFLPTLLECFSASYAEAMYMKVPILTSNLGFAQGLCGKAACYIDALNEEQIGDAIVKISKDKELKETLIKEGLEQLKSFDNYIERTKKYIEIIER